MLQIYCFFLTKCNRALYYLINTTKNTIDMGFKWIYLL